MKNSLLTAFAFAMLWAKADGQAGLDSLAGRFVKYVRSDNTEKVLILTDKAFYSAGETIWLKAWCLDSLSNRYIHKSKNLFVDLVDDKDSAIGQLLFNLTQEKTNGKLLLPGNLKEGYYWLRGYTTNILREDSNRIFVRPVYVVNVNNPNPASLSAHMVKPAGDEEDTSAPRLLLFPEGGSLISGTTANVGFRCLDAKGRPLDVAGYVTDTRQDTVAKFKTLVPGIGKFSFDAFNPRKYVVHLKWKNGRDLVYPLPLIDQFASQLSLVDQNQHVLHMRVSLGDSLYKKNKTTFLLGVSRDSLCFAAFGTDMYEVNVPKAAFPPGKATLFLFDDKDRLVSQRTVLIDNDSNRIVTATDKTAYSPGEKVNMNIGVTPAGDNRAVKALFSVAVTDNRFTGNILALSQDNYEPYTPEQLDLLMLTQPDHYRDWRYDMVIQPMKTEQNEDSGLLDIKGRVLDRKDAPLKGYIVNLYAKDLNIFATDTTHEGGYFRFSLPDYYEGAQFSLKLTNLKGQGQEGKLFLDKFPFPGFKTPRQLKKGLDAAVLTAIRRARDRMADTAGVNGAMLRPATVKGQKTGSANYDQSKRVSQFSYVITSDMINSSGVNGLINAVTNVPGLNTGTTSVIGGTAGMTMNSQPLVVMDGEQLNLSGDVASFLGTLEPTNIDFIEVLIGPQTAIYGVQGASGVILINTVNERKGGVQQINNQGMTTIYPKGYFNQPEFSGPDYAGKKDAKKTLNTDHRSTLYWNANLLTDNNGKVTLNFFTAADQSTYSATIVGITDSGDLIAKRIQIKCQ
jgi:hypothetical protein